MKIKAKKSYPNNNMSELKKGEVYTVIREGKKFYTITNASGAVHFYQKKRFVKISLVESIFTSLFKRTVKSSNIPDKNLTEAEANLLNLENLS